MRKILFLFTAITMSFAAIAQESNTQKELGISFQNLDNFGISYKTGSSNSLYRINTLFISGNNRNESQDSADYFNNTLGIGIALGKEFRKSLNKNLEMVYGFDLSFRYTQQKYKNEDERTGTYDSKYSKVRYEPGINLVFGFNYLINDKLFIGAELLPAISYYFGEKVANTTVDLAGDDVVTDISGIN